MAFVLADRVQETSTSPGGTGTLTLSGSGVPGFKTFSAGIGTGNTFYYTVYDPVTYAWEVGIGSWSANVLTRTTVLSNSLNTTAFISFTNGNTLYVWVDYPASSAVTQADVGYAANQVPLNQYLGRLAYQDALSAADDGSNVFVGVSDVGYQANQVPLNQYLGLMAYQDSNAVAITGGSGSFSTLNSSGDTRLGGLSGNQSLQVNNVASAVNYAQVVGAITAANPAVSAQGTDTNIGLTLSTKGTGRVLIPSAATVGNASNGASQFAVSLGTGYSPGNAWTTNSATFGGIQSTGSSAAGAVGIAFDTTNGGWISSVAPGQGYYNLRFDAQWFDFVTTGSRQFRVQNTGSAVNYIQATGATTGNFPEVSAQGSDANINLKLTTKGTGVVQFGTYTAGILAQAGYITITDAGGTSRRLLVG
jgi:hypothetical protein